MKLAELLLNQKIIVQLIWGEQKIEFYSEVIEKESELVYITPYIHNGNALELNVTLDKSVICNVFTDDPITKQRISWKGIELTSVNKNNGIIYCLRTHSYNAVSNLDDRRLYERIEVQLDAVVLGDDAEEIGITIHDISDTGVSFYASEYYEPKSQQLRIKFSDEIGNITYDISLECAISRVNKEPGRTTVGCRLLGENINYKIYELLKRLSIKKVKE